MWSILPWGFVSSPLFACPQNHASCESCACRQAAGSKGNSTSDVFSSDMHRDVSALGARGQFAVETSPSLRCSRVTRVGNSAVDAGCSVVLSRGVWLIWASSTRTVWWQALRLSVISTPWGATGKTFLWNEVLTCWILWPKIWWILPAALFMRPEWLSSVQGCVENLLLFNSYSLLFISGL